MVSYGYDFIRRFEQFAPPILAEEGDPVGLAVGTLNKPISKVLVTLDVRPEVVQEAIANNADLIFAHHPPIFKPIKTLISDDPQIEMYNQLIKHDIAVYAAHTNLDVAKGGMNDWLAQKVGLNNTEIMTITKQLPYKKLAVTVPKKSTDEVRKALTAAGAGEIDSKYKDCSFTMEGKGYFTPKAGAEPAIGEVNQSEQTNETKIEVVVTQTSLSNVMDKLLDVHQYEVPAYDVYTIENMSETFGLGRVGNLAEPIKLKEFVQKTKDMFGVSGLRYTTTNPDQMIQRVAICGGDGGKFYQDALDKKADVYITGDVYYHTAHDMLSNGLSVIDPGHHIEQICKPSLTELFKQWDKENGWELEIISSELNTDPFQFM